jgi:predicted negative regulator of RcsB-dependent stress response
MTDYMTEEEQVEQLKNWVKQYGPTILAGVILAFILLSGWRYWENYENKVLTNASSVYDEMLTLRAQSNANGTLVQAKKLMSHYPKTPYAQMAAFMLARDAITNKNYPEANKQLNWVIDHSKSASLREIAKTRLARIFISQNKAQDALDVLNNVDDAHFNGLIDELKGDAYLLLNNNAKAKDSYQLALQELPKEEMSQRPLLQMKLDNLATTSDMNS